MPPAEPRTGSIYDLGYRRYDGPRLGRSQALRTLWLFTLRGAFGLGRRPSAKVLPVAITVIAFFPALVQLGVAALVGDRVEIITPWNYFGYVQVPVALFCAAVAPEIYGRDLRHRTIVLYFARALRREDYVLARAAAFAAALAVLTLLPQVVLLIGNGLASEDIPGYLADHWRELPQALVAGSGIAVVTAAVSLALAAQTPRRAYATVAVAAWFFITLPFASLLVEIGGEVGRYAVWFSPFDLLYGATLWVFGRDPGPTSAQAQAGLPDWTYPLLALAHAAVALALLLRRFRELRA
ncbi:hypothetical protein [Tepidiforma sp.]|uniref:hypothetical protein n=1 Tax=Tepidiforma sp. TaxID=2682230 RepID=UPI002ADD79D8|nr:hypothetical protein [Tepidiforma sp.]